MLQYRTYFGTTIFVNNFKLAIDGRWMGWLCNSHVESSARRSVYAGDGMCCVIVPVCRSALTDPLPQHRPLMSSAAQPDNNQTTWSMAVAKLSTSKYTRYILYGLGELRNNTFVLYKITTVHCTQYYLLTVGFQCTFSYLRAAWTTLLFYILKIKTNNAQT